MGFRFSLETVLRLRRSLEDRERLRLQMLLARKTQLEYEAAITRQAGRQLRENVVQELEQGPLPAIEAQFVRQRSGACEIAAARIRQAKVTLEQQIDRQRAAYVERSIGRKVIERLRERQAERYQSQAERRAQAQMEELALLRRGRS